MNRLWIRIRTKLLLFVASLLFISPQLAITAPGLIDDGSDFFIAEKKSFIGLFFSELLQESRTWPLRLFLKKILMLFFGTQINFHYFAYTVFLASLLFLFYKLMKMEKVKAHWALLYTLSLLVLPGFVANFYRLGTAEHFQTILLLASLIFLEKRPMLSILLGAGNMLIKETSIFYNFFYLFYFRFVKKIKVVFVFSFLFSCLAGIILFLKFLIIDDPYLAQFSLNSTNIVENVKSAPLTAIYFVGLLFFCAVASLKEIKLHPSLIKYLSFSLLLLPPFFLWKMNNNYYYHLPMQVMLSAAWLMLLQHHFFKQKSLKVFLAPMLVFFCLIYSLSIVNSIKIGKMMHLIALEDSSLVAFILQNKWSGFHVYTTIDSFERVIKLNSYFFDWSDDSPALFYPNMNDWYQIDFSEESKLSELSNLSESLYTSDSSGKKIIISSQSELPIGISPPIDSKYICGSSFYIKNHCMYYYKISIQN